MARWPGSSGALADMTPTTTPAAPFALPASSGKISEFGGPGDVNSLAVSGGKTSSPPMGPYYVAMRWGMDGRKNYPRLKQQRVHITYNGRTISGYPGDWGPAAWTGRVIDVAPQLLRELGATTDSVVSIAWGPENGPLGPVAGGPVTVGIVPTIPGAGFGGAAAPGGATFGALGRVEWWQRLGVGVLGVGLLVAGALATFGPLLARETGAGSAAKVLKAVK